MTAQQSPLEYSREGHVLTTSPSLLGREHLQLLEVSLVLLDLTLTSQGSHSHVPYLRHGNRLSRSSRPHLASSR